MVFDTMGSNSDKHLGACRYLEIWVDSPILWIACRRHIAELHISTAVKHIMWVLLCHNAKRERRDLPKMLLKHLFGPLQSHFLTKLAENLHAGS